jgi:hypothetical protein
MRKIFLITFIAAISMVFLSGCSKKSLTGIYAPSDNTSTRYDRYDLRTDGTAFYEFKEDNQGSVVTTVNGAGNYEIHGKNVLVTIDDKVQIQFAGVAGVIKDEQTNWVDHVNIIFKMEGDDLLLTERNGSVYSSPKRYVKQK